jgi:molybdopterin molybdotransferase
MHTEKITIVPSCTDDYDTESLSVEEARRRILAEIKPVIGTEKLSLRTALGRILAENVISPLDVPGHSNSAMDGYALKGSDLAMDAPRDFAVIGCAYAGGPFSGECHAGQCVRIMTGAPIPTGTDTVIMQEHVQSLNDDKVRIGNAHQIGQNVRLAGEDIAKGRVVLEAGRYLVPADLGVLASLGIGEVQVRRRPRVAFFSTGDELRSIGEVLGEGDIYDSNRYSLYGMLTRLGVDLFDLGVIRDEPDAIREAFQVAAKMADVVITSGGVSVGDADYIKPVLRELGEIEFWKIAMKPGRPLTFGSLGDAFFFGLPGNPVAVMVTFYQFVQPALRYLLGGEIHLPLTVQATSATKIHKRRGRFEFLRGIMSQSEPGQFEVSIAGRQGSGILTSMSRANCFILLAEERGDIEEGDSVLIQPFAAFV